MSRISKLLRPGHCLLQRKLLSTPLPRISLCTILRPMALSGIPLLTLVHTLVIRAGTNILEGTPGAQHLDDGQLDGTMNTPVAAEERRQVQDKAGKIQHGHCKEDVANKTHEGLAQVVAKASATAAVVMQEIPNAAALVAMVL